MRFTAVLAVGAMITVSGCSSNSQQKLASEANDLSKPGIQISTGITAMKSAGFKCSRNGPNPYDRFWPSNDILCQRDRNYYVVATCIQRVFISVDRMTATIKSLHVPRPVCAGL